MYDVRCTKVIRAPHPTPFRTSYIVHSIKQKAMRKLIAIVQTSFDGFVAGPNGEFTNFIGDEENLAFVCSLIENADAALFGRKSWQLLESNWPTAADKPGATAYEVKYSNWYNSVPK